jgi:peptidyl-prolyl cis-trans isomerase A (cyclophilin A)
MIRPMLTRIALLLSAFAASPLLAQSSPPVTPGDLTAAPAATDMVPVEIDTSLGKIVVALDRLHAPITTANFLHYVDTHRFDGETFYRSMHSAGGGLIQGGVRSDVRKLYPPVADEPSSKTGLKNVAGAISMARGAPGSAQADFFILLNDMPGLDAGGDPSDPDGFSAFGRVVEGMDVVNKIYNSPLSPTKGEGVMKGQFLDPPIKIIKVSRVK